MPIVLRYETRHYNIGSEHQNKRFPTQVSEGLGEPCSDLDSSNFLEPKQYQTIFWGQSLGQYKIKQYKMDQI